MIFIFKKIKTKFFGILTQSLGTQNPGSHSYVISLNNCGSNSRD